MLLVKTPKSSVISEEPKSVGKHPFEQEHKNEVEDNFDSEQKRNDLDNPYKY